MSHATDRHAELIDAAIHMHRALWRLRAALEVSVEDILVMKKSGMPPARHMPLWDKFNEHLEMLQAGYPWANASQCIEIATTIATAASLSLTHLLAWGKTCRKPHFGEDTYRRSVVRLTLMWMLSFAERHVDIDALVERVEDAKLSRSQAQALRDALIREMPGILQWADEQMT